MARIGLTAAGLVLAAAPFLFGQAKKPEITIEQTDYAGFFKALEKHKGKVVLVDVWAEF